MEFIDMFCGMGTIRLGMEQAGHKCVYSIEWDKWKRKIYSIIFGGEPDGTDIRAVDGRGLPRANVWCFGFPCQDISVAGKQLGFAGQRSSLFFEVMRMLKEVKEEDKPKYLFIENVKNLLSVNDGWDFYNLLYTMDEIGYDAEWQLLNSKDYGVPQNRERVFIIGHLRGRSTKQVFPIGRNSETPSIKVIGSTKGENCTRHGQRDAVYDTDGIMGCLNATDYKQPKQIMVRGMLDIKGQDNIKRVYDTDGSPTLTTMEGGNRQPKIIDARACLTPGRIEKRQNGRRFKEPGEPMFTLTKQDIHGIEYQGMVRKLTPKECWRLQGIPDTITDTVIAAGISDTQMYRAAGDACTVNVIYEIAKRF